MRGPHHSLDEAMSLIIYEKNDITPQPWSILQHMKTFRIPKGLWADLEETVIHQDRSFLTEVARSLGLPVAEVLRKCLGTGANQSIPVMWISGNDADTDTDTETECCPCPWWDLHGALWRRCNRHRLSSTLPCYKHERTHSSPVSKILSKTDLQQLPTRFPFRRNGALYWASETDPIPLSEDGSPLTDWTCRILQHEGRRIAVWKET